MEAVLRDVLASPLSTRYRLYLITSYRSERPLDRIIVFAKALSSLARWCRGDGQRLVHVHTAVRGSIYRKSLCVVVAALAGRPVVLQLHAGGGDIDAFAARLDPVRRALLGAAMRRADVVISVSRAGARRIEENFGVKDVLVVPNPAPAVPRVNGNGHGNGNGNGNGNGSHPQALFLGGFANPAKGGDVLLRALPEILERHPDLRVTLAGSDTPPAEVEALQRRHPGLRWAGWLEQGAAREQLSKCDVFVMPSISEGMPVALLEAMAYARAIVTTPVGGIPDVVRDDAEAILVPTNDAAALSHGVLRAIADDELRARLGSAAQMRVEEAFNRDRIFDRIGAIYDELLERDAAA
jgi:glycosyltransferase involved in cell wall biosynthesis